HDARLFLERTDPTDPAPDDHADPITVQAIELAGEAGVFNGLLGDGQGELREPIGAPYLLPVEVLLRVEALHLAREADVEVLGHVELRDRPRPALALEQSVPRGGHIVAHGRDQPNAGDDDAVPPSVARLHPLPPRPVYTLRPTAASLTRSRPCAPSSNGSRRRRSGAARPPHPGSRCRTPPRTP